MDNAQNVQVATGEILPDISLDTTPKISPDAARAAAIQVTAFNEQVPADHLTVSAPELWIYNRALVDDDGPKLTQLVWRLNVSALPADPVNELVLVDAQSGAIALHFNQVADAKNRQTFTLNHATTGLPGTLVCTESDPTCSAGDTDAKAAHQNAGATYDFYQAHFGRDSIDGAGLTIKSTVHYGTDYQNAFWDGTQMVYGDNFAVGDDVVGHELTHGVTQYESGLLYFRQAGAINESLSDVFGELIDQSDGVGNDGAGVRWLMGEDLSIGAVRSMSDPTIFGDPDKVTSPNWVNFDTDDGGVHGNSGVNNKAAFLMTDGGTFNGKTTIGLGLNKTARIYYEVQTNLLTPGSDYADLYNLLQQACVNLIGLGVTTKDDCAQVTNAVQATEMNLQPTVAGASITVPVCPTGQHPTNLFFDNLENTATTNGNFVHSGAASTDGWEYPPSPSYVDASSGTKNFHALDTGLVTSYYYAMKNSVTLPPNAYLRFNHAYYFRVGTTVSGTFVYLNGGIVEYSTDNGSSWNDAGSLIAPGEGGYTGTVDTRWSNPLGGRSAWVGNRDYRPARVTLSSLSGQSVRFRWRVSTDSNNFLYDGWFVDDIQIYTCSAGAGAGFNVTPTSGLTTTEAGGTATFTMSLAQAPTANVTVPISSSNPAEGTAGPGSLVFTPTDWSDPRTVTVRGVADTVPDGSVPYTIVTGAAVSNDAAYNGLNPPDVSVTNIEPPNPCIPRPNVHLTSTAAGAGARTVTVQAGVGTVQSIQFGISSPTPRPIVNALIDYPGIGTGLTGPFTATPGTSQATFTVRRAAAGGQVMVPMIVTDACGTWSTFIGSGPNGF
jgi:hypothetical protein